jgi:acetyltransferase-like isoleucine patch superfamily enzyme
MSNNPLVRWLLARFGKLASNVIAYYNRPKIIFPHEERGIKGTCKMGEGCALQPGVVIDCSGDVTIGDDCIFIRGSRLMTHSHAYLKGRPDKIGGLHDILTRDKWIGDHVYIGQDAMILPQCERIGDYAIIGARAVVTRDIGPNEIWAGNPARKVGERSDEDGAGMEHAGD